VIFYRQTREIRLKIGLKVAKRDELVLNFAQNTKSCTSFYGRWLSPDIKTIIEAHANTYRAAKDISKKNCTNC
jgi:hypothetical protein